MQANIISLLQQCFFGCRPHSGCKHLRSINKWIVGDHNKAKRQRLGCHRLADAPPADDAKCLILYVGQRAYRAWIPFLGAHQLTHLWQAPRLG